MDLAFEWQRIKIIQKHPLIYNVKVKDFEDLGSHGVFLLERMVISMFVFPEYCPL